MDDGGNLMLNISHGIKPNVNQASHHQSQKILQNFLTQFNMNYRVIIIIVFIFLLFR